jgi:hypothetical protein
VKTCRTEPHRPDQKETGRPCHPGTGGDDRTRWRRHLVLADLDVASDCDSLTFVEHTEPVALFDPEVMDRVLRLVPALDVGLLVHDQGAEVPRVEHDDVGGLGRHIEHHEGADQDAETTEVGMGGDLANKYSYALADRGE